MSKNSIIPFLKDYLINFLTRPFLLDTNELSYRMKRIKELTDAPFTSFYDNGEVNYDPIANYVRLLINMTNSEEVAMKADLDAVVF